jgi:hypothetical protein
MRTVMFILCVSILFFGCTGGKATHYTSDNIPDFVTNPPQQAGKIFGTGTADQQSILIAKETADIRARKEIALTLSQKISAILKSYLGQTGIGSIAEVQQLSQLITHALMDGELIGVTIEKRQYANGKIYSLASYLIDDSMKKTVTAAVNKSFSSNESLYSQFMEKQGFQELDKQLEKMKGNEP